MRDRVCCNEDNQSYGLVKSDKIKSCRRDLNYGGAQLYGFVHIHHHRPKININPASQNQRASDFPEKITQFHSHIFQSTKQTHIKQKYKQPTNGSIQLSKTSQHFIIVFVFIPFFLFKGCVRGKATNYLAKKSHGHKLACPNNIKWPRFKLAQETQDPRHHPKYHRKWLTFKLAQNHLIVSYSGIDPNSTR